MKKITRMLIVSLLLLGCQNVDQNQKAESPQQQKFADFLQKNCNEYGHQLNDIQRMDYLKQFEKDIVKFCDTLGVFHNWKGKIKSITTFEGESIEIDVDIEVFGKSKVNFINKRFFTPYNKKPGDPKPQSLFVDSELIYRQLKNLTVGTIVYFDGFIASDSDGISYTGQSGKDNPFSSGLDKICYPDMNFYLISISKDKLQFSEKLKQINIIQMNIWKTMNEKASNILTENQFVSKLNEYKKQIDPLFHTLNANEREYTKSFGDCLFLQFIEK